MRVKKISAFVMAFMLVLSPFTLFSFASDSFSLKDSGSPVASTYSLRQSVSTFSARAVTLPSAPAGYQWVSFSPSYQTSKSTYTGGGQLRITLDSPLEAGTYFVYLSYNHTPYNGSVADDSTQTAIDMGVVSGQSLSFSFDLDKSYSIYFTCNINPWPSDMALQGAEFYVLKPLPPIESDAISSGFTFSSGILSRSTRSIFETISANFGSQPAGKYLINIYHWGDSYDVRFQMHDGTERVFYPTVTTGGVTTFLFDHFGGTMIIKGNFTASNDETSAVDGLIYGSGASSNWVGGEIEANGPLSWVFNIKDIVAIPYELADDNNFGLFSPIIGFFRDQFSDMKSWIAIQIEKISGDSETKSTVDSAASELAQEVNDLNTLHGQLDSQASTLEQQFSNDFSVPSEVSGQTANLQLMYSGIFSSLGVFSIFIWLPVVLAVIKKLLRL